ncbi:isopentenyl-diphosphate Delta-isomerase [candidate division KSB1 bacterium]|nr:isopentenyl-diphosphate Delta-isomerase [candidate division KSB1 bacterium]
MQENVILVNETDVPIGTQEKIKAHEQANLHRAFSVFIFNSKGEMLLQQRAKDKYHSGGLWTNACCSHPRPGEETKDAAHRRLQEEMGFDCQLEKAFHFIYKTEFDHGLTEHELDHVFIGKYEDSITPNPDEVEDYKWINVENLKKEIKENPGIFTSWFKIAFDEVLKYRAIQ